MALVIDRTSVETNKIKDTVREGGVSLKARNSTAGENERTTLRKRSSFSAALPIPHAVVQFSIYGITGFKFLLAHSIKSVHDYLLTIVHRSNVLFRAFVGNSDLNSLSSSGHSFIPNFLGAVLNVTGETGPLLLRLLLQFRPLLRVRFLFFHSLPANGPRSHPASSTDRYPSFPLILYITFSHSFAGLRALWRKDKRGAMYQRFVSELANLYPPGLVLSRCPWTTHRALFRAIARPPHC